MLQSIADRIWLADGPDVSFHGFPYPTRMVTVRLSGGGLWVWSPIDLNEELRAVLACLGPVQHIVSPNKLHHLFLSQWQECFPQAHLWGPASTIGKRPDLIFEPELTDEPPAAWSRDIDQAWFRGSPLLDEVAFFHRASGTAIFGDLVQAFDEDYLRMKWKPWQRYLARLLGITALSGARAPLDVRLSFLDRRSACKAREKVLNWRPEVVVMAHGQWQRHGGSTFLAQSLSWMG
ncbi:MULTISPECIES: DUF4336 domain-containing protein [Bradyrhizobium]|uniref:DUF4336 domain-containing protein n=1 Tax=Bradyrhizobium TaxID=374 RepID=UPI0030B8482A|nr:DUF4336 domain-containing protein [Bradyrhizobium zhengyangense]